jgi:uroporphyrinogen III methyltransferase/synthase
LKAGDPLVFGRGGEEAVELAEAGIGFEIVPGISAALGAAAYAGIPLTHRDWASRVTFATGHDVDGSHCGERARPSPIPPEGTLVLYMAGRKLDANAEALVASGWSPETPAAIVVAATTPAQRVIIGTIATLAKGAAGKLDDEPAVVIVGDVVRVRERLFPARNEAAR